MCNEMVFPRGLAPRTSAFALRRAWLLHFGNMNGENGAVCRCCPGALCVEDRRARCYTNTAGCYEKWPMEPVSRRPGRFFKPLLIYLSHPSVKNWRQGRELASPVQECRCAVLQGRFAAGRCTHGDRDMSPG